MATVTNNGGSRVSTRQKCYDVLRRMLICGQIAPGSRLPEVEWSERLDVHRGAVREAMVLLEHDGLLTAGEKGGFFAPLLGDFEIEEIILARTVLETGALKLIADRKLAQDAFQPMLDLCETMQRLHDADIELGFCEADFMFHQAMVALSGNSRLIQMHSHSAQLIFNLSAVDTIDVIRQKRSNTLADHREIAALVVAGDIASATMQLEKHLDTARKEFL
ncbi:GntR family transcriptional regulator [Bremerella sp. JC770]|uniref:GntR family transcriptional regulator n=1 Tax=Bremerella sp. JC770 TaxID=3232137 RepID=UPI0034592763